MLPKANRLTRPQIELIIKTGKNIYSPFFSGRVGVLRQNSLEATNNVPKASFVVSKKAFPSAVLRNKAKRKAREAWRAVSGELKSVDVVFFLKKEIFASKKGELSEEFRKLFKN